MGNLPSGAVVDLRLGGDLVVIVALDGVVAVVDFEEAAGVVVVSALLLLLGDLVEPVDSGMDLGFLGMVNGVVTSGVTGGLTLQPLLLGTGVTVGPFGLEILGVTKWSAVTDGTEDEDTGCLLYTSPSPRDRQKSRMPSSA